MRSPLEDGGDFKVKKSNDNSDIDLATDVEKSGWGFFSDEISFFLVDFCKEQLTPIQLLVFYSYYVNGMTLEDIAERLHSTHQAVHNIIKKIEYRLKYSWKYMDRWSDHNFKERKKRKKKKEKICQQ